MKWVVLIIGACDSAARPREWQDRQTLLLMSMLYPSMACGMSGGCSG
jgi:hypothetical protein